MSKKVYELQDVGSITIVKRKSNKNIRLTIGSRGEVKVSIPYWVSYKSGLDFATKQTDWIKRKSPVQSLITQRQRIGHAHEMIFELDNLTNKTKAKIKNNQIIVSYPPTLTIDDLDVQAIARKYAIKALRQQSQNLIPKRLEILASQHDLSYQSVDIKLLKRRWGSCDQYKNIVFNLYLIQLPWELIDYVILHELTHTIYLNHQTTFWDSLANICPDAKQLKKKLHAYRPDIM